jgi:hypothetical protein
MVRPEEWEYVMYQTERVLEEGLLSRRRNLGRGPSVYLKKRPGRGWGEGMRGGENGMNVKVEYNWIDRGNG